MNDVASKVGAVTNNGAEFEGIFFDLGIPLDLTDDKTITMNFWAEAAVDVLMKLEQGTGADTEVTASHGGTGWETISFGFTSSDGFSRLTMFVDGPGTTAGTFYIDDIEQVATAPPAGCTDTLLEFPIDFDCESTTYDFVTFNGASYQVIDNPELSGVNARASKVGEIVNIGGTFEGGAFTLDTPVDFSTDKSITMKVYSTVALPVLLKFEGAVPPIETPVNHGGTGWEQLTFDFTSSDQFTTLVLFIDGPGTTAGTFYFDDIEQVPTSGGSGGGGCTGTTTAATTLPVDFEGCESFISSFSSIGDGGVAPSLAANPSQSGINMSDNVLRVVRANGINRWGGIQNSFPDGTIDITNQTFKIKVYSGIPDVTYRFELALDPQTNPVTGNPAPVFVQVSGGANTWTELEFTFINLPATPTTYNQLVIKPDNPNGSDGELTTEERTFYFDDLRLD